MLLEKPAFSPVLNSEAAERKVSSLLKKKLWKTFSFSSKTLFLIPYWFYSYDIYSHEKNKTTILDKGIGSLNAFSNELDDTIAALIQNESAKKIHELEETRDTPISVVNPRVSEDEAREIISVRLASDEQTSKDNVIVAGLELLFVPIWLLAVKVDGHDISLRINAVNGDIENQNAIPTREKGFSELTTEVIEDLKTPQGWIHYSTQTVKMVTDVISDAAQSVGKSTSDSHGPEHHSHDHKEKKEGIAQDDMAVIILAVVAILVILFTLYKL